MSAPNDGWLTMVMFLLGNMPGGSSEQPAAKLIGRPAVVVRQPVARGVRARHILQACREPPGEQHDPFPRHADAGWLRRGLTPPGDRPRRSVLRNHSATLEQFGRWRVASATLRMIAGQQPLGRFRAAADMPLVTSTPMQGVRVCPEGYRGPPSPAAPCAASAAADYRESASSARLKASAATIAGKHGAYGLVALPRGLQDFICVRSFRGGGRLSMDRGKSPRIPDEVLSGVDTSTVLQHGGVEQMVRGTGPTARFCLGSAGANRSPRRFLVSNSPVPERESVLPAGSP